MLQSALVASAFGVALVYFVIAALVVPKISLGAADRRFQLIVRAGGTLFFVGCGLTHLHIALHTISAGDGELHELGFHLLQLVGGWVFVFAALRYLTIRVEPRERENQLRRLEELQELSMRDPLTGTYNRRRYEQVLEQEIARYERYGHPVSVAHLDVDDFKGVNDAGGHAFGDEVLRIVGVTAGNVLRDADSVVRLGGDEFGLILPETEPLEALAAAERVRAKLATIDVGRSHGISVSIGVASCPEDESDAEALTAAADRAMYWVKRNGKAGCALAGAAGSQAEPAAID